MSLRESKLVFTAGSQTIVAHHEFIKNHTPPTPSTTIRWRVQPSFRQIRQQKLLRPLGGWYIHLFSDSSEFYDRQVESTIHLQPATRGFYSRLVESTFQLLPATNDFCRCLGKGTIQTRPATRGFYRRLVEGILHLRPTTRGFYRRLVEGTI